MAKPRKSNRKFHRFPIRLRNLTDLRAYCSLVDSCPFDGYIQYRNRTIPKDDVVALLDCCCSNAKLMLYVYYEKKSAYQKFAKFLSESELSIETKFY